MTQPAHLRIQTRTIDDGCIVALSGDIDFSRAPELRAAVVKLLDMQVPRLVLDVAGVSYMDSSGVAVLVETLQIQRRRGHRLVLCHMQPKVQKIFEISRLDTVFEIVGDVETASKA